MQQKANLGITRDDALTLMKGHLKADNLQKHSLATAIIMRKLAQKMDGWIALR